MDVSPFSDMRAVLCSGHEGIGNGSGQERVRNASRTGDAPVDADISHTSASEIMLED
jgi:hypothetical protein